MEVNKPMESTEQEVPETPSLIRYISSNQVSGFDNIQKPSRLSVQYPPVGLQHLNLPPKEIETPPVQSLTEEIEHRGHQRMRSVSISMPPSPIQANMPNTKQVLFDGLPDSNGAAKSASCELPKPAKFHSQPIQTGPAQPHQVINTANLPPNPNIGRKIDRRFDSFKTWSGKLERQITNLRGKPPRETLPDDVVLTNSDVDTLPVDRYFDALEGPELDTLRASEEILLPDDKRWPFLLRFPISSFGICLGVSSQAIMWKTLASSPSTKFLHLSPMINIVLWCISVALVTVVFSIYSLKVILYFEAVRREYYHPIRVNFFFAPWIAVLFLALGVPTSFAKTLHPALWYILMTPFFCLELKIYGQWMSGGQRRLSKVANPSNHLSVVGNFVGALLGASMGLVEGPIFFFAVGFAHYMVLFVTLYQRLPTNETLPKELHPVFFLFVAAPSVASMAWAKLQGSFDYGSRIAYFIALFLYFSLAVRINFFRGFKFSLAWWAYTFPMTGAAIATVRYSNQVTNVVTQALAVMLSLASTLTVSALLITTILHAFVLRDLFPNDLAIAISDRKPKPHRKWFNLRNLSSDYSKDIENFLKFSDPEAKDLEASVRSQISENEGV
ncbi:S-type anion channel [Parasponia andersonii]|uniref:S-type anion channel n=1 Tax=Parasponia andersonii TaxID=3476 RepID=A0A2P5CB30_PARAD|nr:S-type anion channel [Parasponia andersonii]